MRTPGPLAPFLIPVLLVCIGCWSEGTAPRSSPGGPGEAQLSQAERSAGRIEEVLTGRVPGLTVKRLANGTYSLRIRGSRAVGGGEPLVLLDGVPMGGETGQALSEIDPQTVDRVDVIKDAASLSMYGVRGANGVIAITTRTR